jgi:hypothetical protein
MPFLCPPLFDLIQITNFASANFVIEFDSEVNIVIVSKEKKDWT